MCEVVFEMKTERGERAASELYASANREARRGEERKKKDGIFYPLASRSLCSPTFTRFLALRNKEVVNSLVSH